MSWMKNVLTGLLLGSIFISAMVLLVVDFNLNYGFSGDTGGYNETYNKFSSGLNISNEITNITKFAQMDTTGSFLLAPLAAYKAVRIMYDSVDFIASMVSALSQRIGLPDWVLIMAVFTFTISITVIFIAALARWRV